MPRNLQGFWVGSGNFHKLQLVSCRNSRCIDLTCSLASDLNVTGDMLVTGDNILCSEMFNNEVLWALCVLIVERCLNMELERLGVWNFAWVALRHLTVMARSDVTQLILFYWCHSGNLTVIYFRFNLVSNRYHFIPRNLFLTTWAGVGSINLKILYSSRKYSLIFDGLISLDEFLLAGVPSF